MYAAMSPSGGTTTVVDQPITWSPVNKAPAIGEAEMVGGMARRRDRDDRLPVDLDRLAVREHPVGRIIAVERRVGARADRFQRQRRAADDRRSGRARPAAAAAGLWSRWVWVHMIAATGRPPIASIERIDMLGQVRPGIDDRELVGRRPDRSACRNR